MSYRAALMALFTIVCAGAKTPAVAATPVTHVVVILQENRSFENIFHGYPGARTVTEGRASAGGTVALQPVHLMTPWDVPHSYDIWLTEFNNGAMDGFDKIRSYSKGEVSDNPVYSYAMRSDVQPYWDMAKSGALADAFFADHRSQTFAGHQFPIAGASGPVSSALPDYDASGNPSGLGTCDAPGMGKAINLKTGSEDKQYVSCFDYKTIADLLSAGSKTWRVYIDGLEAHSFMSGFSVIKHIRDDAAQWKNIVSPATSVLADAKSGSLPNVCYVIGPFVDSDHAGQRVLSSNGPSWVASIVNAIGTGPQWESTAVMLVYDDWGGWYDEQAPPTTFNAFEPGFRLPFVLVSAYAKRGYISHQTHYVGSILHFIETNFELGSLGTTDAHSDDLADMFDLAQKPLPFTPIAAQQSPQAFFYQPNADYVPPGVEQD